VNRNQLCSCGSGLRYKHCHGAATAAPVAEAHGSSQRGASRTDPHTTLQLALAQQQEGRLASAEALYEGALEAVPGHFDALHMLGVVKLQLGKFEEAARLLVAALPSAPATAAPQVRHNLGLCLVGLARERGELEALTADPPPATPPASFLRGRALLETDAATTGRISIVVADTPSVAALQRSFEGVRTQNGDDIEVIAAIDARTPDRAAVQAVLDGCGVPVRLIVDAGANALAGQVNIGAAAATGTHLCLVRAGDRWAPRWPQRMRSALNASGRQWGFGGLRVVEDDGTIVRFGASAEVEALLRAQDDLYGHGVASAGLLSFNPIAGGRNLMVTSDFWRRNGGLAAGAADSLLDWAWRAAQDDEPVYLDEPGYRIPRGTERAHLHDGFARLVAPTAACAGTGGGDPGRTGMTNPDLRRWLSRFWVRQWRQLRALDAPAMPAEVLLGCAAMLGVAAREPATSSKA
jgi:hypothetical protein